MLMGDGDAGYFTTIIEAPDTTRHSCPGASKLTGRVMRPIRKGAGCG